MLSSLLNIPDWLFPASTEKPAAELLYKKVFIYDHDFSSQVDDYFNAKVRENMIEEEGYRNDVYLDTLGKPTVGIGHLIRPFDNLKLGDTISDAKVEEFYQKDIQAAVYAARDQALMLNKQNDTNFIIALVSVNYQLGTNWTAKFPNTFKALKTGNYQKAINNLNSSLWAQQTPVRTTKFINAIKGSFS